MKYIFSLICCVCFTSKLFAQNDTLKNWVPNTFEFRLSNGIAFPINDFKSNENRSFGFANNGYKGAIDLSYKFKHGFGALFILDYAVHGTDANKIAKSYIDSNPGYTAVDVKSGTYSILSLLLGVEYTINLKNNFDIQFQLAMGIANVEGPDNYSKISSASPFEEITSSGKSNSPAYQGKIALNYAINKFYGIGLYTSYYETRPDFNIDGTTIPTEINTFSIGIQLIYKLPSRN